VSRAEAYGRLLPDAILVSVMHMLLGIRGGEDSRRALEAVEDVLGTVR
jgi:hypothetical protein